MGLRRDAQGEPASVLAMALRDFLFWTQQD
jgi:hypothetical protein